MRKKIKIFVTAALFPVFLSLALPLAFVQDISVPAKADSRQECVVIYGDTRTGHEIHKKIVNVIIKHKPKVVFHVGDLVDNGYSRRQWRIFNGITKELRRNAEFYPALGNHERESPLYFKNFNLPGNGRWYSLERFGVHFIVLDSNIALGLRSEQYGWLETELRNIDREGKPVIVLMHHPLFSAGKYAKQAEKLRCQILPLLEKYHVAMVFSGHEHNYQRSLDNSAYYVITGGGGAPLYGQSIEAPYSQKFFKTHHYCVLYPGKTEIIVRVYDVDSKLIDEFKKKLNAPL